MSERSDSPDLLGILQGLSDDDWPIDRNVSADDRSKPLSSVP